MPASTAIAAGKLRHVVTIAQANTTEDGFGGANPDLGGATPLVNLRASIEALSGRELYAAQQKDAEVTHKVTVRYVRGITAGMLVWFGVRQFQIQYIENPLELNKLLLLICLERDDSAREEGAGGSAFGGGAGASLSSPGPQGGSALQPDAIFTGDGVTATWTLPQVPKQIFGVWIRGLLQTSPGGYTISGATITPAQVLESGDHMVVLYSA